MLFEFATSQRIIFGQGEVAKASELLAELGERPFIVIGSNTKRAAVLLKQVKQPYAQFSVANEPSTTLVNEAVTQARAFAADCVVAFGGGSVIDTAKAVAALSVNEGDVLNYLEVVGQGNPLLTNALAVLAIPTTSGTGAEVTKNAVLSVPDKAVKVSLRHSSMIPKIVIVDSQLTHSCSPHQTAFAGLDALTQVIEPYTSKQANPITDALCLEGVHLAAKSLEQAVKEGQDADARDDMALLSLLSGMALANAKLGAVHGFAGVLGGISNAAHGAICACLLPHVTRMNVKALQERDANSTALERYANIARIFSKKKDARASDLADLLKQLNLNLNIPRLRDLNVSKEQFESIVQQAKKASSMKGNPVVLTDDELTRILEEAF